MADRASFEIDRAPLAGRRRGSVAAIVWVVLLGGVVSMAVLGRAPGPPPPAPASPARAGLPSPVAGITPRTAVQSRPTMNHGVAAPQLFGARFRHGRVLVK